jgi:hypothetical protein
MKIDNLTIANVRGRLKMNKFHFGPRSSWDFWNFFFVLARLRFAVPKKAEQSLHSDDYAGARYRLMADFSLFLPMLCVSAYRQPEFLEWRLTRLDGAGPDTPWYCGLGPHDPPTPVTVAKHCWYVENPQFVKPPSWSS